jgi:hypothetical protein
MRTKAHKMLNFSEWAAYLPEQQKVPISLSCQDLQQGRMPVGPYTLLHPEAKLLTQNIETSCAAARA